MFPPVLSGGQRNWIQVICNGGVAAEFAVLYLIDVGTKETLVNFPLSYNASWLCMAVLGMYGHESRGVFDPRYGEALNQGCSSYFRQRTPGGYGRRGGPPEEKIFFSADINLFLFYFI